jgi:CDP-glucose 4,6-dehydratase
MFANAFRNKTVWISGHTGFKGAWLSQWLVNLGAEVHGFSLEPPTTPALFHQLGIARRIRHQIADIRDAAAVRKAIEDSKPDFVFHLAAQSLVRASYSNPVETYATNVMGTAHVLEALRSLRKPCAAVFITTDKCYENREWHYAYREEDPLGGHDPYSSSKAAAEILIQSFRRSFFKNHPVKIASARAGNVIGGGDWALDRIMPDCIRALQQRKSIAVRNKFATRPWQHVLEPLSGYLWLAALLAQTKSPQTLCAAFNFGPTPEANRTVEELVEEILRHWRGKWVDKTDPNAVHEATFLQLAIDKARAVLRWSPVWTFSEAIEQTVTWYRTAEKSDLNSIRKLTSKQIALYTADAKKLALPWTSA